MFINFTPYENLNISQCIFMWSECRVYQTFINLNIVFLSNPFAIAVFFNFKVYLIIIIIIKEQKKGKGS